MRLSLENLQTGVRHPRLVAREFNKVTSRVRRSTGVGGRAIDFFEADWDNLVLLDACRYDYFAAQADLPGRLESRRSNASATVEYLRQNVDGRDLTDVVYVTANPQLQRNLDRGAIDVRLHDLINVWREDGWDDERRTVRPETMAEYTRRAVEEHPDKRIVAHFIQPHSPYIGPTGRRHEKFDALNFFHKLVTGEISVDPRILQRAYAENLDIALDVVGELLADLPGRTVVSADHGEMLGDRGRPIPIREYGHPPYLHYEKLIEIPWLVHENGARKEIRAGAAVRQDEGAPEDDVVEDRLKHLGYV
ncbi:MAG: hypothetical protein ABEJ28_12675 [Salinigranum sp.]